MTTRIEFVDSDYYQPHRIKPYLTGFCIDSTKEVLDKFYPEWWIVSYRHRDFLRKKGVAIYDVESEKEDKESWKNGWYEKIESEIVGYDQSLNLEHLLEEFKQAKAWKWITRLFEEKDSYSSKIAMAPGNRLIFFIGEKDFKDPTRKNLNWWTMKKLTRRIGTEYKHAYTRSQPDVKVIKNLNEITTILLEDEPMVEAMEVMFQKDKITRKWLYGYLKDNIEWPKVGSYHRWLVY